MSDSDLVAGYGAEPRTVSGHMVMTRVFEKARIGMEFLGYPILSEGLQLTGSNNQPLIAADYLEVAQTHGSAEAQILGFVALPTDHEMFPKVQALIGSTICRYLSVDMPDYSVNV